MRYLIRLGGKRIEETEHMGFSFVEMVKSGLGRYRDKESRISARTIGCVSVALRPPYLRRTVWRQ